MWWLRVVGILMLLGSVLCFVQFRSRMAAVAEAKAEANRHVTGASYEAREREKYERAVAAEAGHRASARNWFLSGAGLVAGGAGLVVVSWVLQRRATPSSGPQFA